MCVSIRVANTVLLLAVLITMCVCLVIIFQTANLLAMDSALVRSFAAFGRLAIRLLVI